MNAGFGVRYRPDPPAVPDKPWDVELGQKYRVSAECLHTASGGKVWVIGTVKWIHPQKRYALLCCRGPRGVPMVECYHRTELKPENRVK